MSENQFETWVVLILVLCLAFFIIVGGYVMDKFKQIMEAIKKLNRKRDNKGRFI